MTNDAKLDDYLKKRPDLARDLSRQSDARKDVFAGWTIVCVLLLLWAVIATIVAISRVSAGELALAKEEARVARADADSIIAKHEGDLQRAYPGLKKYETGSNTFRKDSFVGSFNVDAARIRCTMKNSGPASVQPAFTIHFLNLAGVETASLYKHWILDSISPGETRVDEDPIRFAVGEPAYYYVVYD